MAAALPDTFAFSQTQCLHSDDISEIVAFLAGDQSTCVRGHRSTVADEQAMYQPPFATQMRKAMADWREYPYVANATFLTSYEEANEVLVSEAFQAGSFEEESAPFKEGTVFEANGDVHQKHRRLAAPLFSRRSLTLYEHGLLDPAIDFVLEECRDLRSGADPVRADLVNMARRILVQIASRIIGLDGTDIGDRMTALLAYADALGAAADVKWSRRDHAEVIREGLRAKAGFIHEFYGPSRARRAELLIRHRRGAIAAEELPEDLLMLMLAGPEGVGAWTPDLQLREIIVYLTAGIRTTAHAITRTLEELGGWWEAHPEDAGRIDTQFLRSACNEALRLHPASPAIVREAVEDVILSTERAVEAGERVAIDVYQANRDRGVFGADADHFNPRRSTTGRVPLYGLSFGAGPHLCVGKPLVTANTISSTGEAGELQRIVVRVLRRLLMCGVRVDREQEPVRAPTEQDRYEAFSVLFTGL
jgi:cytochrome P450